MIVVDIWEVAGCWIRFPIAIPWLSGLRLSFALGRPYVDVAFVPPVVEKTWHYRSQFEFSLAAGLLDESRGIWFASWVEVLPFLPQCETDLTWKDVMVRLTWLWSVIMLVGSMFCVKDFAVGSKESLIVRNNHAWGTDPRWHCSMFTHQLALIVNFQSKGCSSCLKHTTKWICCK